MIIGGSVKRKNPFKNVEINATDGEKINDVNEVQSNDKLKKKRALSNSLDFMKINATVEE